MRPNAAMEHRRGRPHSHYENCELESVVVKPPCDKCQQETRFAGRISPFAGRPGMEIFRCSTCDALIWVEDQGNDETEESDRDDHP